MAEISSFTSGQAYTDVLNKVRTDSAKMLQVNGSSIPIAAGGTKLFEGAEKKLSGLEAKLNLNKYTAPATLTINAFNKIGADIDETLKSSMLLQVLRIKGTDILCTAFCFVLSLLSCQDRNNLYNAINNINNTINQANEATRSINDMVKTTGAMLASVDTLTSKTSDLFGGSTGPQTKVQAAAAIAAVPMSILGNIEKLAKVLKLGLNFKFMLPTMNSASLWDLAQCILSMLQQQAIQMADEALSKLIQPVEEMLKSITPSICFGNMAQRLMNAILDTLERFKNMILAEIGDLFTTSADFNAQFRQFNLRSAIALELMAFMDALSGLSAHFFDVARACGIAPCTEGTNSKSSGMPHDIYDPDWNPLNSAASAPTYFPDLTQSPKLSPDLEVLSDKLAPTLKLPEDGQTYVTPQQIVSVYNVDNAPKKILDLINNGALNNILDNGYSIYNPSGNNIKIVYSYNRGCGSS